MQLPLAPLLCLGNLASSIPLAQETTSNPELQLIFDPAACIDISTGTESFGHLTADSDIQGSAPIFQSPVPPSSDLVSRQVPADICRRIARNDAVDAQIGLISFGKTGEISLEAGATYVFSWDFDVNVGSIAVYYRSNTPGSLPAIQHYQSFLPPVSSDSYQFKLIAGESPLVYLEMRFSRQHTGYMSSEILRFISFLVILNMAYVVR